MDNGWNEYSKLVINELERLNSNICKIDADIESIKRDIIELKTKEEGILDIKKWKSALNSVASPERLKDIIIEIEKLKTFKVQAITVWTIVNILIGIAISLLKFL